MLLINKYYKADTTPIPSSISTPILKPITKANPNIKHPPFLTPNPTPFHVPQKQKFRV